MKKREQTIKKHTSETQLNSYSSVEIRDKYELSSEQLRWYCSEDVFKFETTKELEPLCGIVGQDRAIEAIELGARLFSHGYNTFVSGVSGTGRLTTVKNILDDVTRSIPTLYDYCYVHNFQSPDNPKSLRFAAGRGKEFAKVMDATISLLRRRIPQLFEEEGFRKQRRAMIENFTGSENDLLAQFTEKIAKSGFILGNIPNESGTPQTEIFFLFKNTPVPIQELDKLVGQKKISAKQAEALKTQYNDFREELVGLARRGAALLGEFRLKVREYDRAAVAMILHPILDEILANYPENGVEDYLRQVENNLLDNLQIFITAPEQLDVEQGTEKSEQEVKNAFTRYGVNVILDNSQATAAPVIVETTPSYGNLFGGVENLFDGRTAGVQPDYRHIKAGALLRANQGYLIVNALDVMREPNVWPALKRVLLYGKLEFQPTESVFMFAPIALKPEPIELSVKVIMIGEAHVYQTLYFIEEDFRKIFKVNAEFEVETARTAEMTENYARFIHKVCEWENLLHADRSGAAAIVEWGVEHAAGQRKITLQFSDVADVLRESDYYARAEYAGAISRKHVAKALAARTRRNSKADDAIKERIVEGVMMIATEGERMGQINGLTVYSTGLVSFGKPARITASVGIGKQGIVNIEREADMSGAIHDKGHFIVTGFMIERFARRRPLVLSASIAFEQSYGGIDGDSASVAEIVVLLSEIAEVPVRQWLAITGSVNQKGDIQPIGGVNEKISGFFEICAVRGLTGRQGVVIPTQNVLDLMLPDEIIEAVSQGKFHIYPISRIEEAVELMTGIPAGEIQADNSYPPDTLFGRADARLENLCNSYLKQQNNNS
ncbi:ATP-binding protein [Ignavibacteria bacterium]|nr:AAA family ATPase [Bacteroidota bacterium]MCZ2131626.1 AAA family ATPase [Bacteroidota bacterium]